MSREIVEPARTVRREAPSRLRRVVLRLAAVAHVERHPQGPRTYLLGRRVHECHLGIAVAATGAGAALWFPARWAPIAIALGLYMLVKDARDLVPSTRDTGAWRIGVHRRFVPLRTLRHAEGLPALAGAIAFGIGIVNLVSALTPNLSWRGRLLLQALPVRAVPLMHTLAVPASVGLVATAFFLERRSRRALHAALALLLLSTALNLLKGLDFEEAAMSLAGAGVLWWGRSSFCVAPARAWKPLGTAAGLLATSLVAGALTVWLASGRSASTASVFGNTLSLLGWTRGSVAVRDELSFLPWVVGAVTVVGVAVAAYALFRPKPPPRALPPPEERAAAARLVRKHGSDTLAYFKLRRDAQYLFSPDRRAFLGYRVERGVALVAGDPVGHPGSVRELVREACTVTESHGLRIAVLGASEASLPLWRDAGLSAIYIGDEAIVETARFSLEGRAIRKVRQAVSRVEKAGYTADVVPLCDLDPSTLEELERISTLWRRGRPERGFSMAMDALRSEDDPDSVVVLARDRGGAIGGYLHFVPSYGRPAVSLSFMRRDRQAPNGLTEFLVVKSIELLRARGIEEVSLNFVAFGRLLERPTGRLERTLARLVVLGSRYFQMESLYRFNAKFGPRWEPRYLLYEGLLGLPRAGVAALGVEGQLPRLPLPRRTPKTTAAV